MKFLTTKRVNDWRRKLMHILTKGIGKSSYKKHLRDNKTEIKRILICRPNQRLGNLLLTTPLIEELTIIFPNCKIDIIVKGSLASILYCNFKNIDKIIILPRKPFKKLLKYIKVWLSVKSKKYDLAINAVEGSSSGKLLTQFSSAKYKVFGDFDMENQRRFSDRDHMAKKEIYNLRHYLNLLGYKLELNDCPKMTCKLSKVELAEGKKTLSKLVNNNKKTICVFTFATGLKCYSKVWWKDFYSHILKAFPDYNIIEVLPKENVSQIDFEAISFYSENIREIGALMANTAIFIGADSGIMHLASASQVTTIGLFNVTNPETYGPYNNNSFAMNTNDESFKSIIAKVEKVLALEKEAL